MAKLTKAQTKAHNQAVEILNKDVLTADDKDFVFANWNEGATQMNGQAGAFFTPLDLAYDMALAIGPGRILDLCAGIGALSYAALGRNYYEKDKLDITCIELNPTYYDVGKKLVPEATWINADVFDVMNMNLGHFDYVISNPPFGKIKRSSNSPNYTGAEFEFHVIDIASHMGDIGLFIVPQMSAGFNYSGRQCYERHKSGKAFNFQNNTGLYFESCIGIDTKFYIDQWKGVSPLCEVVEVDFTERNKNVTESEGTGSTD